MKKLLKKIESNHWWRSFASLLAIVFLMICYNWQGVLLNKAIKLKQLEDETSYDQQIMLETFYILAFVIIILLGIILYVKLTQKKVFERISWQKLKIVLLMFATSVVIQVLLNLLDQVINGQAQTANNRQIEEIASLRPDFAVVLIGSAILLSPIFEEIIYRGLFIDGIFKEHRMVGTIVQAVVFGASHSTDNIIQFLIFFVTGLFLGLIYWKTKKLQYSMLGHFTQNLIAGAMMVYDLIS
ncbi:CPBP family intramembrane glutamic endopeptidase [Xylocopilactobacillus apicola]|uniref:CAAX prenyl protease 2/Lysostaphin resistance protein A-like domain-containing protein n=1 Tax=Xylocopilactobacillus apicola TaxID=2932184 RepID=A0AAU9D3I8_9LACO|nr:type II CAAX endopeptidase family protein [Xylocopilactobacillus apicola]BDR59391.1 hypothetical protein XA3_18320 [Xylocopilactobacillus apicola]